MNRYNIQQTVRTPLVVHQQLVTSANFVLAPIRPLDGPPGCGFLVNADVEAANYTEAYVLFLNRLIPLIDVSSVITQCAIHAFATSSHLIYKRTKNSDGLMLFYHAEPTSAVGMMLDRRELADLERVLAHPEHEKDGVAFTYLRQSNIAAAPVFWLATLIMAVEAFAGTTAITRRCRKCDDPSIVSQTDKNALRMILGEDLYKVVYQQGRLRHKLMHGGNIDEMEVARIGERVYRRLVLEYLPEKYGLRSIREIVNPPRSESIECIVTWTKWDSEPDLLEVIKKKDGLPYAPAPLSY